MNKYEEALKSFEEAYRNVTQDDELTNEKRDALRELVDKESPMKPFKHGNCNVFSHKKGSDYCWNCGQKLDWE